MAAANALLPPAERYFSHRRDGITGRQATLIWLEPRNSRRQSLMTVELGPAHPHFVTIQSVFSRLFLCEWTS